MNIKKVVCIIVLSLIIACLCSTVYASNEKIKSLDDIDEKYHKHEHDRISEIIGMKDPSKEIGVIVPNVPIDQEYIVPGKPSCPNCTWFTVSVCAAEAIYVGTGTHWFGTCEVDYFTSNGAEICPQCTLVLEYYGEHYCWEIHDTCAAGWYDVCPMDVS